MDTSRSLLREIDQKVDKNKTVIYVKLVELGIGKVFDLPEKCSFAAKSVPLIWNRKYTAVTNQMNNFFSLQNN